MEFVIFLILLVVLFRWRALSRRMAEMNSRITASEDLLYRIRKLEETVAELRAERSHVAVEPAPVEVNRVPEPVIRVAAPVPANFCTFCGKALLGTAICECRSIATEEEPAAEVAPPPIPVAPVDMPPVATPVEEPAPVFAAEAREKMASGEWEALVGGNWLNKLGVFVLVIGIALFLGYSFTQMGPAGRVGIGIAVSLSLLGGGALLERREQYRIIGRGLLGGGWAALYFTTYAMQAVEAAKIVTNPALGAVLLLVVAVGMIAHSLRYRSETVTGLAYFVAFVTLAITPVTKLSVIALIPLAGSLLYVAHRFDWSAMSLLGLVATYGTCASRGDSGASLVSAQVLFSIYWVLFESFDLLRATRRREYKSWEILTLPLNALAFAGLSYVKWSHDAPESLYALAGGLAAAYLASSAMRARLRPPSSFAAEATTLERALSGGYEGPITLTAILTAAAVFLKFHGAWANVGLLAEAEILFVAGLLFREAYPRRLAAALFAAGIGKVLGVDLPAVGEPVIFGGRAMKSWTPTVALAGLLFYVNRALRTADLAYGYAASAMFAWLLGFETPERYLSLAWFVFAAGLFAFGWLRRLTDFRLQAYGAAILALGAVGVHQLNIASGLEVVLRDRWLPLVCSALLSYAGVLCALRSAEDRLGREERIWLRRTASWAATALLALSALRLAPNQYVGLAWLALALPMLELGLRGMPEEFELQSAVMTALGSIWVLFTNAAPIRNDSPVAERMIPVYAAALAYLFAARLFSARRGALAVDLSSMMGSVFLMFGLWALAPAALVGPAWAAVSLLLVEIGLGVDLPSLRLQGHLAGAAAFGRLFFANFDAPGTTVGISHRLLTVVPVLVSHYYQWSRQRAVTSRQRWEEQIARAYLYTGFVGAVALLRFELDFVHVVIGWALFALGLLFLGQRWDITDLRWQSYVLAGLTFWRSAETSFYSPDSLAGAAGRIVTAAIVIVSFFAAQLLIPQSSNRTGFERRARLFYSVLATLLLTGLLFHEVSGSLLTVAWSLEGVVLMVAGFPLRDRILRISGLSLFLICILKLFLYDLRQLETGYRILSFIALGVILMAVSWIYTRFRDRIQQYL